MHATHTKPEWRQWALETRKPLDMPTISAFLRERLTALPDWQTARHVLLYLAMPGEVTVEEVADDQSKNWYIPRCAPKRRLVLHPFVPGETSLRAGPFGIREPDPERVPEVEPETIDLVVVPGLVLSEDGWRIGYGGGYYDRLLPRLREDCLKVGAMPEELVVPTLTPDPWDARLDVILTPNRTIRIG